MTIKPPSALNDTFDLFTTGFCQELTAVRTAIILMEQ
jgi:hypothetical protein